MKEYRCACGIGPALSFKDGAREGFDVFEENKAWSSLLDASENKRKKVSRVRVGGSFSGRAERLAGKSGKDAKYLSSKLSVW